LRILLADVFTEGLALGDVMDGTFGKSTRFIHLGDVFGGQKKNGGAPQNNQLQWLVGFRSGVSKIAGW